MNYFNGRFNFRRLKRTLQSICIKKWAGSARVENPDIQPWKPCRRIWIASLGQWKTMEKFQYVKLHDRIFIIKRSPRLLHKEKIRGSHWCVSETCLFLHYEIKAIFMSNTSPGKDTPVLILATATVYKLPLSLCKSQLIVPQQ